MHVFFLFCFLFCFVLFSLIFFLHGQTEICPDSRILRTDSHVFVCNQNGTKFDQHCKNVCYPYTWEKKSSWRFRL